ncbi:MAG: hypothetical protein MI756_13950 [Chromatiales bacterium]|nr:hypothetical protein [Chromatiales bacterium]
MNEQQHKGLGLDRDFAEQAMGRQEGKVNFLSCHACKWLGNTRKLCHLSVYAKHDISKGREDAITGKCSNPAGPNVID